jgi:hypothetical protein
MLGIEHGNIPIQLDLWGNEVIFRGKGQTTLYGPPKTISRSLIKYKAVFEELSVLLKKTKRLST